MNNLSLNYTGIGSLPFKGDKAPDDAINYIFENFSDIPYWAQLPHFKKEEDMVLQFCENFAGLKCENGKYFFDQESDEFFIALEKLFFDFEEVTTSNNLQDCEEILDNYGLYAPYSNAFKPFIEKLKTVKPPYVKGSITGPFTFSTSLNDKNSKCAFYDETLRDVIVKTLTLKALWQIKEFNKVSSHLKPIIFMDEPSVSQIGSCAFLTVKNDDVIEMLSEISNAIKKFGALSGVHCCGKTDWNISINANVDIINFDAYSFTKSISTYAPSIQKFMEKGGYLAFGIVPTLDVEALNGLDEEKLFEIYKAQIKYLTDKKIPYELIMEQSFITPSCGCGSLNEEQARKALLLTKKLSKKLRNDR